MPGDPALATTAGMDDRVHKAAVEQGKQLRVEPKFHGNPIGAVGHDQGWRKKKGGGG